MESEVIKLIKKAYDSLSEGDKILDFIEEYMHKLKERPVSKIDANIICHKFNAITCNYYLGEVIKFIDNEHVFLNNEINILASRGANIMKRMGKILPQLGILCECEEDTDYGELYEDMNTSDSSDENDW